LSLADAFPGNLALVVTMSMDPTKSIAAEVADKIFKERTGYGTEHQRKTAWLRACSYWSAFHALAIRADAKGGIFPNQLLGSIVRIISGGALFCGG